MRNGKVYIMTVAAARKVARMLNGESVGYSSFPASLAEELLAEGVLVQSAFGRRGSYRICDVAVIGYVMWKDVALFWPSVIP